MDYNTLIRNKVHTFPFRRFSFQSGVIYSVKKGYQYKGIQRIFATENLLHTSKYDYNKDRKWYNVFKLTPIKWQTATHKPMDNGTS